MPKKSKKLGTGKKKSYPRSKQYDSAITLLKVIEYLIADNIRLRRTLDTIRRHEGREFGGGRNLTAAQDNST